MSVDQLMLHDKVIVRNVEEEGTCMNRVVGGTKVLVYGDGSSENDWKSTKSSNE